VAKKHAVTPEQALLAAIEAAPQDMLPRLVYADWLDERNDPRGEYLRLEVERHRAEVAGTALEPSILTRLGELEDTLDVGWFYKTSIGPLDDSRAFSRFWRALTSYEGSYRRMREHLERIPEGQLRFLVNLFHSVMSEVAPHSRSKYWPYCRFEWAVNVGSDLAAWVVMQGKTFYDHVRSQPEHIVRFAEQREAAQQELRKRSSVNRSWEPGPIREAEEDRIQFQQSRLDYIAMAVYRNRHGRDLPLFGG
jgi:uncharacterized protein (TIGR02996 family)